MVTYYNKTDLTSFGEYLLSERRKESLFNVEDREDVYPNKVYHADFENWLEEQRTKRRAKVLEPQATVPQATVPQATVPQWLAYHMADAPEELRAYVFKVFPERQEWTDGNDLANSFTWGATPEGSEFWMRVDSKNGNAALKEMAKQQRG